MASLARVGMGALMAGGVAVTLLGLGSAPAMAQSTDGGAPPPPPTTAHGTNFLIKTQLDNNYCISVASGTAEGRTVSLAPCNATADTQRWGLTWNNDESNSIVDTQGMCLDGRNRKVNDGKAMPVMKCRFGDAWQFTYTATGQLKETKNGRCLQVAAPAAATPVVLATCNDANNGQHWKLAR